MPPMAPLEELAATFDADVAIVYSPLQDHSLTIRLSHPRPGTNSERTKYLTAPNEPTTTTASKLKKKCELGRKKEHAKWKCRTQKRRYKNRVGWVDPSVGDFFKRDEPSAASRRRPVDGTRQLECDKQKERMSSQHTTWQR